MAGGRKKHRHTGPEYGVTWLMGAGPQDNAVVLTPGPLQTTVDAEIQNREDDWASRLERLVLVENEDEMDETFKSLGKRAQQPDPAKAPHEARSSEMSEAIYEARSRARSQPTQAAAAFTPMPIASELVQWSHQYRDEYSYLRFLEQVEPARYAKAVESIEQGRGVDVARALPPWYAQYRAEHGWD